LLVLHQYSRALLCLDSGQGRKVVVVVLGGVETVPLESYLESYCRIRYYCVFYCYVRYCCCVFYCRIRNHCCFFYCCCLVAHEDSV
jgi:hypothetical protein